MHTSLPRSDQASCESADARSVGTRRAKRRADVHATGKHLLLVGHLLCFAAVAPADILNVPADYPTIQAAIDAAVPGDHIVLAPGVYTGPGNWWLTINGDIVLRGTDPWDESVVAATAIAGGDPSCYYPGCPRVTLSNGATIEGITVRDAGLWVNAFMAAITDPVGFPQVVPGCSVLHADCNGDGCVNVLDINPFVLCVVAGGC
ncbi:hypothetical protein RAS1_06660 [Phycisphaerae bacterium RAS1]|nr:hypothetical protein RAS1_06660 [Phycisphaerae bacterium RAS1]